MGLKSYKEKKAAELEEQKASEEFDAAFTVKMERKKVEKFISELDTALNSFKNRAIDAHNKGYDNVYRQMLGQIKVLMYRKRQAETFLYQMDSMMDMQKVSKSSASFLDSMNSVIEAISKTTISKTAIEESRKNYHDAASKLSKQSGMIDQMLGSMDGAFDIDEETAIGESDIEAELLGMGLKGPATPIQQNQPTANYAPQNTAVDNEMDELKKLFGEKNLL